MGRESGLCAPSWMFGKYTNSATVSSASSVTVLGLATVPVDIVAQATVNKRDLAKLTFTLTDPNGQRAVLCSPATQVCSDAALRSGLSAKENTRDDEVNGRWTLRVQGPGGPKITRWTLQLSSRWD